MEHNMRQLPCFVYILVEAKIDIIYTYIYLYTDTDAYDYVFYHIHMFIGRIFSKSCASCQCNLHLWWFNTQQATVCNWSLHDSTEDCHSRAAATVLELTSKFCKAKIEMVCRSTYMSHVVNYDVMSHQVTFKQGFESFTWIDIIQMAC